MNIMQLMHIIINIYWCKMCIYALHKKSLPNFYKYGKPLIKKDEFKNQPLFIIHYYANFTNKSISE